MLKFILSISLFLVLRNTPGTVVDFGYCFDVSSPECKVHDYWPNRDIASSTGQLVYWLRNDHSQICFVDWKRYTEAAVGKQSDCIWRDRRLDAR